MRLANWPSGLQHLNRPKYRNIPTCVDGKRFDWRGVDKITLQEGKIAEEIVYFDTAPLRARRTGQALEALVKF